MKVLKNVLAIAVFSLTANFLPAADNSGAKKPESVQIQTLLKSIDFDKYVTGETKLNISFFINAQNEVLIVSTNNKDLDNVVKVTLNYKKIAVDQLEYNKLYTIPVVIK
ncbi:MAG: hypothetical protein WBO36_01235 [Saprospiraceae bacterium]